MTNQRLRTIIKNDRGMALLMVMGSIAILTYLLADFTFETKINQLKAYNSQDRSQASLTAEAGIHFTLAKMRIYQEARNKLEQNKSLQSAVKPSQIDSILTQPFVYPIPLPKKAGLIQKNALKDFENGTIIKGSLNVVVNKISGFLNPNNLRIPRVKPSSGTSTGDQGQGQGQGQGQSQNQQKTPLEITEGKILSMLEEELRLKREEDDAFNENYSALEADTLLKELKYFVNSRQTIQSIDDPVLSEIESIYQEKGAIAKHAPMTSLDEFYLLAGWPEVIIDLVKDRFTVHEIGFIALNELNTNTLRLLFPDITEVQSGEFFRARDGDDELGEAPSPFQSVEDFKTLVVNKLAIVSDAQFEARQKEFEAANLRFGVAGKLYRVESTASYNTATVKITAFIDLPVKPEPPKPVPSPTPTPTLGGGPAPTPTPEPNQDPKKFKLELMPPRIVEYRVD